MHVTGTFQMLVTGALPKLLILYFKEGLSVEMCCVIRNTAQGLPSWLREAFGH